MPMHNWVGMVAAVGLMSAGTSAQEREPEFIVSIPSLTFQTHHEFAGLEGTAVAREARAEVRPRVLLNPLHGSPIVGSDLRLRLTELVDGTGVPIGVESMSGRADRWMRSRGAFLFPGNSSTRGYGNHVQVWRSGIAVRRMPARISSMVGEVSLRVVEEDATRELVIGPGAMDSEIVPGLRLVFDPVGGEKGTGELRYTIDASRAEGRTPELSAVIVQRSTRSGAVPFAADGRAAFSVERTEGKGIPVSVHVVYRTRDVRVPLRAEGVAITGTDAVARARCALWAQSAAMVSESDGFEVRLLREIASGTVAVEDRATPERRDVWLSVSVRDVTGAGGRASFVRCRVQEMTDEAGHAAGRLQDQKADPVEPDRGKARLLPELAVASWGGADRTLRLGRVLGVRVPMDALPARLGRVAGAIEFQEAVREVVREVELKPMGEAVEVTPGVRVIVRDPMVRNGERLVPRENWVEVVVDVPAGMERDGSGTGVPRVESVEFLDADGVLLHGPAALMTKVEGRAARYIVMQEESVEKAMKVRVRAVVEERARVVPFVFEDVPCIGE